MMAKMLNGVYGDGGLLAYNGNAVLTSTTPQYPINTTVDLYSNSNNSNCGGEAGNLTLELDTAQFTTIQNNNLWIGMQSISWQIILRSHGFVGLYVDNIR
jgi:hypothetical protein